MDAICSLLTLKYLGIDAHSEFILFIRHDSHVCRSEGLDAFARVSVTLKGRSIIATVYKIHNHILGDNEASLSLNAWSVLQAAEGDSIIISHAPPLKSSGALLSKIYGNTLSEHQIKNILEEINSGSYSDVHISAFLTACCGPDKLSHDEVVFLTKAMIEVGDQIDWGYNPVVDKHCVGGLPGNRTTLVIVPIVAAAGLVMPKTSSRAITSPAGTADTMEVFAPVNLSLDHMRRVVEKESGCIVWGGSVNLSPADDILIRIERVLDFDGDGQLVASILSKKIAAGSSHVLIDMPIGPTAKIRNSANAHTLKDLLICVGHHLGITVTVHFSDGSQPVGRGIGPMLEAQDVLDVLSGHKNAPQDLRERALTLAGYILEFSPLIPQGSGYQKAQEILDSGQALQKFYGICEAQGGLRPLATAHYKHDVIADQSGIILSIDNRRISRVAKLAGAPFSKKAGVYIHAPVGQKIDKGEPLYTVYAETTGELNYALEYSQHVQPIIQIGELL